MSVTVRCPGDFAEDFPDADTITLDDATGRLGVHRSGVTVGLFNAGQWLYAIRLPEPALAEADGQREWHARHCPNCPAPSTCCKCTPAAERAAVNAAAEPESACKHEAYDQHPGWRRCVDCGYGWTPDVDESVTRTVTTEAVLSETTEPYVSVSVTGNDTDGVARLLRTIIDRDFGGDVKAAAKAFS